MKIRFDATIKPYVRMTKRGKYVDPQAMEYLASKGCLQVKIKELMSLHKIEMLPGQTALAVWITLGVPSKQGHRCDVDNLAKAVLDACNGILYPDDRWVDFLSVYRYVTEDKPFVSIGVAALDEDSIL